MSCGQELLAKLHREGFIFIEYDPQLIIKPQTHQGKAENILDYISTFLRVDGESMHADWEHLEIGESIRPHFHSINGSFQAVTWLPESDFRGREFLYGTKHKLKSVKPKAGLLVLMAPNNPDFIHGVAPLLSDSIVHSYGFTSFYNKDKNRVFNADEYILDNDFFI